jgi:Uma2 family endonuclease
MSQPAKRRATYEDLAGVAENLVAELIDGVIITHPRPASPHARASSRLGAELMGPFDRGKQGPGGWIILDEPELHFHGNALIPDLAGWRRESMPELPHAAAFELAPDWLCEVLSPGTMAHDRGAKLPIYAREGVSYVWLVDPLARLLEVFRLEGARYMLEGTWRDAASVRAVPFDAIELELGALWER